MPKNPLKFGRRKSSSNVLDDTDFSSEQSTPAVSSFRVLERPEKINLNGDLRGSAGKLNQVQRPFNSPLAQLRGRSAEELSAGVNRGSGGTTNSGSSGYNESSSASARYSSSSTLPSSVDAERELDEDELFPRRTKTTPMYQNALANADAPLPPPPSFANRAARAFSWGQKHGRNGSGATNPPPIPPVPNMPERSHSPPQRERAMTTSSYASTAVPSKPNLDLNLGTGDFGGEFSNMFSSSKNSSTTDLAPPPPPKMAYHRTASQRGQRIDANTNVSQESEPMFPPRTHSRQAFKAEEMHSIRLAAGSPYSTDSRSSNEGLMSASPVGSPRLPDEGPPVPVHGSALTSIRPAFLGKSTAGYSLVSDRTSPGLEPRMSQDSHGGYMGAPASQRGEYDSSPSEDESTNVARTALHDLQDAESYSSRSSLSERSRAATVTKKSVPFGSNGPPVARKPLGMPSQVVAGASRAGAMSPESSENDSLWDSSNTTPKATNAKLDLVRDDTEPLFDSSPVGPPSRAVRPQHMRTASGTPKKMTKAQFERLQRGDPSSGDQSDDDAASVDDFDDEDDADRAKRVARQRAKQEANMSVYRQQMKKVTGGGPSDLPSTARPSLDRAAASAPASTGILHLGGIGGQPPAEAMRGKQSEDDDEDVPLGILQAHGFPSASRPPTRQADSELAHQRRNSSATSVVGGGAGQGNLPPFARRLPADPYFGSSIVNPSHRESMGMSNAASVYGGMPQQQLMPQQQPSMGHPGGLVGIIAGEERAKAARRGSPNPVTGAFTGGNGNMPNMGSSPNLLGMGAGRSMTMGSVPQVYTPSGTMTPGGMIPGMPMLPQMPMMPMTPDPQQEQMKQFMQMQMQIMQNMMAMQQQQMGQTPPPQQPAADYLGVPMAHNRQSTISHGPGAPSIMNQAPMNQGRAMTMMSPPTRWDLPAGGQRPNSAMPMNTYARSGMNVNMNGGGPGPGYTPSIAPSERSNIGMPSRYRPVTSGNDDSGRSQTMTSSFNMNGFNQHRTSTMPLPQQPPLDQRKSSTIRLIDKPKGSTRAAPKAAVQDEDDDEGWAEMRKKRENKKKFGFGRKNKAESPAIGDLYQSYD